MRSITLMLMAAAIPSIAPAQVTTAPSERPRQPEARTEIGLSIGGGIRSLEEPRYIDGSATGTLSLLRNHGRFQYGLQVDGSTMGQASWSLSAAAVGNYRIHSKQGYWYAGALAGYTRNDPWGRFRNSLLGDNPSQGYVFGLQSGFVRHLGRRLSLTGELALRSRQTWDTYYEVLPEYLDAGYFGTGCYIGTYDYKELTTKISVPVTIGLRYRF